MKAIQTESSSELESLAASIVCGSELEQIAREGAQKMLQVALQLEVEQYIEQHAGQRDHEGKRLIVRNGSLPGRDLQTGLGPMTARPPRVNDRREGKQFTIAILPPYLRRVASIENLIPALYLKGVSTGEMGRALESILGLKAAGLSPANITRLKDCWQKERIW
jgi:putative transposase